MGTRRILQGGEDTWPGDGGATHGEAFRVALATDESYRAGGNYVDAIWSPTTSGCLVVLTTAIAVITSANSLGGSSGQIPSVSIYLQVGTSGGDGDFVLWGISMPT